MSTPTTTAPALPDAIDVAIGKAYSTAYDAIHAIGGGLHPDDPAVSSLTAVARSEMIGLRDAIRAAIADAEARGRASAMAEVDAACEALEGHDHGDIGDFVAGRISGRAVYANPNGRRPAPGDTWWASGSGPDEYGPTPTAAILAAAAALGGDA